MQYSSCITCKSIFTNSNFKKHIEVCSKNDGAFKNKSFFKCSDGLICIFCNKESKNKNSHSNHERLCKENPNRIYKNGMLGKKGTNQYKKAKELGLPKPVLSKETKEKFSKHAKLLKNSYASKESLEFINRILKILPEIQNYKLFYFKQPHEFVLNYNGNKFCYDFTIYDKKLIIEYNGVKFHPKSLEENFIPIFKTYTKEDLWNKDRLKERIAKENGFTILYFWSDQTDKDFECLINQIQNIIRA